MILLVIVEVGYCDLIAGAILRSHCTVHQFPIVEEKDRHFGLVRRGFMW